MLSEIESRLQNSNPLCLLTRHEHHHICLIGLCGTEWYRTITLWASTRCADLYATAPLREQKRNRTVVVYVLQTHPYTNIGYLLFFAHRKGFEPVLNFRSRFWRPLHYQLCYRCVCCKDRIRTCAILLPKQVGKT